MTEAATPATEPFEVNGRVYTPPPKPVVVVCIDGCADEYLDVALARGRMPNVARMLETGWRGIVRGALPSFTNVNNACVVTGSAPDVHGIAGNFFLDTATGKEVMTNSAEWLRGDTILAAAARSGRRVAMVTAKDKLRRLLSKDLNGIAFSAEKAAEATVATHGIEGVEAMVGRPAPPIYSGAASLYAMEAAAILLEQGRADFLYVTLSDYVQHKHAPDEAEAVEFYAGIDANIGRYLDAGAVVGVTADHGMNGKTDLEGRPAVVYVEELLRDAVPGVKVVCTITDPYVVHHGALGGFVCVYVENADQVEVARAKLLETPGIAEVLDRATAARQMELPPEGIGDLVVMGTRGVALGRTREDHDLSQLGDVPLRSHGSRYEELVPLLTSTPLAPAARRVAVADPRSFDLYAFLMGAEAGA